MRYRMLLPLIVVAAVGCRGPFSHHWGHAMRDGGAPTDYNLPPATMLMHPGPGVDGPGPGVLMPEPPVPQIARSSQINFAGPDGMMVAWDVSAPGAFDSEPLIAPGRYNFPQGALYRLKLTNIPGRPGVELYPTLEVGPTMPRTDAYLAHNPIPVRFTEEDFDQVLSGNFVTKVIYLPDAEYQELAVAGVEELVSTRLDPGVDPIVEADRRGAIMAIVRIGNIDLQAPGAAAENVVPAGFYQPVGAAGQALPPGYGPMGSQLPPPYLTGVTVPEYGMPMTGTPIGLPGPPHIPLGGPAGLKRHTIHNHTPTCLPAPVGCLDVHVRQDPGISYPKPPSAVYIHEKVTPNNPYGHGKGHCPPGCEDEYYSQ